MPIYRDEEGNVINAVCDMCGYILCDNCGDEINGEENVYIPTIGPNRIHLCSRLCLDEYFERCFEVKTVNELYKERGWENV